MDTNEKPTINYILSKFWVIEELNGKKAEWSTEAHKCERLFKPTTKRIEEGIFFVQYSFLKRN